MESVDFTPQGQMASSRAKPVPRSRGSQGGVWALRGLLVLGLLAAGYFFSWWFVDYRTNSIWVWLWLLLAVAYTSVQIFGNWILYLAARQPVKASPPPVLSVDVFVTAYREPYAMIERALRAACAMRGAHRTWLLDDGKDPALAALAERLGAGYLTRDDHKDAKAGNLNAALPRTNGEVIVIFDVDHVPQPEFLEQSLGHFADPRIGFVQVMLTFGYSKESWVARAAMETSLEFYNPTYLGSDAIGGATMMGSNALIRRVALESIGGYQPGLAEDLATSLRLHAAGWKSAYVADPLAPGQAPPSFIAWFIQQLKWARGVFELLLTAYPQLFRNLTWGQRLSYAVRMTKYWVGPAVGLHLFATIAVLIFASAGFRDAFHVYLLHLTPLVVFDALIRYTALKLYQHPAVPKASLSRAVTLIYASWPIYLVAWLMAVARIRLSFRSTPKSSGRLNPMWLLPQFGALLLLSIGLFYTVFVKGHRPSLLLGFAILQAALQLSLLVQWLNSEVRMSPGLPRYLSLIKRQVAGADITRREIDGRVRSYLTNLPFSLDPLPLEAFERAINLLLHAQKDSKQVFIASDRHNRLLSDVLISNLTQGERSSIRKVYRINSLEGESWPLAGFEGLDRVLAIRVEDFKASIESGDILICITTGGESSWLEQVCREAREAGGRVIAFTGISQGSVGRLANVNLHLATEAHGPAEDGLLIMGQLFGRALRAVSNLEGHITPTEEAATLEQVGDLEEVPLEKASLPDFGDVNISDRATLLFEKLTSLHREVRKAELSEIQLRLVLSYALELFGASSGSLVMLGKGERSSQAAIAYEGQVNLFPADHLLDTLQKGLAGWVINHRQPALVTDTHRDSRWLRRGWEYQNHSRSAISVPLVADGEIAGVLTLVHHRAGWFRLSDLMLLIAITANLSDWITLKDASRVPGVENPA